MKIFVFGELQRGRKFHHMMEKDGVMFLGKAKSVEKYYYARKRLHYIHKDIEIPGAVLCTIHGEIYDVSKKVFQTLNDLEIKGTNGAYECKRMYYKTPNNKRKGYALFYQSIPTHDWYTQEKRQ